MNENEGTRITGMIRNTSPGLFRGRRSGGPKKTRVPQTSQNHDLQFGHAPSLVVIIPPKKGSRHQHTHHRPAKIRWLLSVMSVGRLHREVRGGICCANGDL